MWGGAVGGGRWGRGGWGDGEGGRMGRVGGWGERGVGGGGLFTTRRRNVTLLDNTSFQVNSMSCDAILKQSSAVERFANEGFVFLDL